ncbi:Sialidase precursor [Novipirellula galeiformis]|uniref:exo-alpha-sialidase n=1 Tax=Novipirellula galeiformis TaxID=2528004 RepID=A0A5C6CBZ0_9BACT|nr:sialidase family protein [Novipirellula galeiformis]TWU22293.1 Sialidase precursor [Novipirellula galeiformis]
MMPFRYQPFRYPTLIMIVFLLSGGLLSGGLLSPSHAMNPPNDSAPAKSSANADTAMVDVFVPKQDGYPAIRIPALVTTKQGTLLAFAEARQGGDHSQNDIVLKRSTDHGTSWGPIQVVHGAGELALNNPQPVVLGSGRVLLMYQRSTLGERNAKAGFGPDAFFTFTQFSDDDGKSWSDPVDVSRQVKRAEHVTSVASGPGIGIVLERGKYRGRIVMPFNQGPYGEWQVYAAYSDDEGQSWKMGDLAPGDGKGHGNEVQMVELQDGRVMLNARTQGRGGTKHRKVAWSEDGGQTWTPLQVDVNLIDPVCQASILRYSWSEDGAAENGAAEDSASRILFSNPASQSGRQNGILRLSEDEGQTWPKSRVIYPAGFAYSCLTKLADGRIGVLFERDGYKAITFTALSLDSLLQEDNGADGDL